MHENLSVDIKIRFAPSTNEQMKKLCKELGIKSATWIRQIVLNKLQEEYNKNGTMEANTKY